MKNGGVLQQYVYFTILIFIKYNANSTYLFKLKRLLHHRVNPTVQLLEKKNQFSNRREPIEIKQIMCRLLAHQAGV